MGCLLLGSCLSVRDGKAFFQTCDNADDRGKSRPDHGRPSPSRPSPGAKLMALARSALARSALAQVTDRQRPASQVLGAASLSCQQRLQCIRSSDSQRVANEGHDPKLMYHADHISFVLG